jgi:tetratricopeptide (TPR) repeat protein
MKKQLLLAGLSLVLSTAAFGQKKNVTDAILLMRKYNPMGEIAANKKTVAEAKNFIDLAAANAETAEDFKMHLYRAQIYYCLNETAMLESASTGAAPDQAATDANKAVAVASFKKVIEDPKKTFTADAQNFINSRTNFMFDQGIAAYNAKKYEAAAQAFIAAHEIKTYIGEDFKDAEVNTSLAANYAVEDYLAAKKYDEALAFATKISDAMPQNIDILISIVNINLQKGDVAATEKYINKALALDPKNKQLYYVLGTSYMDKKENDKATEALKKALEIDPAYNEALYQLGAHLYNLAVEKRNATVELDYKDPKAAKLEAEAMDLFKQALEPLEKYDVLNPSEKEVERIKLNYKEKLESGKFDNNKLLEAQKSEITSACAILDILYKTNMKLGNIEKAKEYKARLDALKN